MDTGMLAYLFIYLGACVASSEHFEIARNLGRGTPKASYIDPNAWPKNGNFNGKTRSMETPFGIELLQTEHQSCKTRMSLETTVTDATVTIMRRFINLLLKRAHFEDSEGNAVPLGSISSSKDSSLVMSLEVFASQEELNILRKFGQKTRDISTRQIDEVITNIFSSGTPFGNRKKCSYFLGGWMDNIRYTMDDITRKIDFMPVLYFTVVLYIIWSINVTLRRKGNWKMLFMCFLLPSIAWEFSRVYEEENIKHLSEQLRLGEIPDHCNGIDRRGWWERLVSQKSDVECYERHLQKMGHPVLKVSILKVALSQVQLILDLVVRFVRNITDLSPGEWFFIRWFNKAFVVSCLTTAGIVIGVVFIVVKFGGVMSIPFFFSIKKDTSSLNSGSRVQPISPEDALEEPIKPPPRRRNGNWKRSGGDDGIDGRPIQSIVYKITSQNVHFNAGTATKPSEGTDVQTMKEEKSDSDSGTEKRKCVLCKSDSEKNLTRDAKDEVEIKKHESEGIVEETGSDNGDNVNCDIMAGGDAPRSPS